MSQLNSKTIAIKIKLNFWIIKNNLFKISIIKLLTIKIKVIIFAIEVDQLVKIKNNQKKFNQIQKYIKTKNVYLKNTIVIWFLILMRRKKRLVKNIIQLLHKHWLLISTNRSCIKISKIKSHYNQFNLWINN